MNGEPLQYLESNFNLIPLAQEIHRPPIDEYAVGKFYRNNKITMLIAVMITVFSFRFSDDITLINLKETSELNLIVLIYYIPNISIPIGAGYLINYLGVYDVIQYSHSMLLIGTR
jgi:hypothetical protein